MAVRPNDDTVKFRLLGALAAETGGGSIPLGGRNRRALLAVLLLHANEVVSSERLIEYLWGESPPDTASKIVQNNVSYLRKELGPDVLLTRPPGYVLRVEDDDVDARRFERLAAEGHRLLTRDEPAQAAETLREALALWHGPALADLPYEAFAATESARLEELRLTAIEDRIEAELALGRHADLVAELESLVAQHPLRERLPAQLMIALYRSGRQAEALGVYKRTREHLVETLGIEPGPALQRLERAVLQQDASLDAPEVAAPAPALVGAAVAAPAREVRKPVSVVFAAVSGSDGASDPEAFRIATETLARVLERHGASVEETPTGGVMAVFGVPTVHEDDALRALRAARDASAEVARIGGGLAVRAGVSTGDVIAANGGRVVGEVVHAAARLEQAARPGQILVGDATASLARESAQLEPAAVPDTRAWQLVDVSADAPSIPRHFETAMVGRERELEQLRQALDRAVRERTSYLFTVLGPAGIGKSRLAHELVTSVASDATVLVGRSLPYGEGITYWPLAQLVRGLVGDDVREGLRARLAGIENGELIAERIAGAIGHGERVGASEDIFWAARRLFEHAARERPLVLVFEDLHWAEPTLLDLVDHVAEWTRDAPILLLCLARPELLEERPTWAGGRLNATSMLLEPLSETESDALLESLRGHAQLDEAARARIAEAAEGNPLFLEQMLALASESGEGEALSVPPSIHALLAARVDRLPADARSVLECASVIGREFTRGALADLLPDETQPVLDEQLRALVRRELIRPGAADDGFRFRHILIRDAAYDSVTKQARAELHERFAERLTRGDGARATELEELVGYHLEQSYRWRSELGADDEAARALARRASERLASAGRRAYGRGDIHAAVGLLSRAADLLERDAPGRAELVADLAEALRETGDFPRAEAVLSEVESASEHEARLLEAHALVIRLRLRLMSDAALSIDELERGAEQAVAVFEELGDDARLAKAWELRAWAPWFRCRAADAETALQRALEHARRAGDVRTEAQTLNLSIGAAFFGPMPVPDAVRLCEDILSRPTEQRRVAASALRALAGLKAMEGRFDEAYELIAQLRAVLQDLGLRVTAASAAETYGIVAMLAGAPATAERELRTGYESLREMGETLTYADLVAKLAQALYVQGEYEQAFHFSEVSERATGPEDLSPQVQWRAVRAKLLARRGSADEGVALAREAVELAARTDFLVLHGDALLDLAEALRLADDLDGARPHTEEALRLYERKGAAVPAARARALLSELA